MAPLARVVIHESQFPERVRRDLLESLRSGRINHKFHYDSLKQTNKWLALHEAYSPARTDSNCLQMYDCSFAAAAQATAPGPVHVIGLGCGGGQKDAALLKQLTQSPRVVSYTPCDVSVPMALVAQKVAAKHIGEQNCFPVVCDLAGTPHLRSVVLPSDPSAPEPDRQVLFTFFGMLPNFDPEAVLPNVAGALKLGDLLLLSANLAPGPDYFAGVQRVLPLYDNELTREWLLTFLLDLGCDRADGRLRFRIEEKPGDVSLLRIVADFEFIRERTLRLDGERIEFVAGTTIHLFFSYRHTPALVQRHMEKHGLTILQQWITRSGEEGVFLARLGSTPDRT